MPITIVNQPSVATQRKINRVTKEPFFKITYVCPHCNKKHSHGMTSVSFPVHRASHCLKVKGDVIIHG